VPAPNFDIAQAHRYFAIECNNAAWEWLECSDRSPETTETAIHAAEASFYHWSQVGTAVNVLRAAYLLANVYAAAKQSANATRCLRRCQAMLAIDGNGAEDWDRAFVQDAEARAALAGGDMKASEWHRQAAQQAGGVIADAECRQAFEAWFARWPNL
jgi:hypothetical protein